MAKIYIYQNTAQKIVGILGRGWLIIASLVVKRLLHLRVLIKNTVQWIVETKAMVKDSMRMRRLGKEIMSVIQEYINGFMTSLENRLNARSVVLKEGVRT